MRDKLLAENDFRDMHYDCKCGVTDFFWGWGLGRMLAGFGSIKSTTSLSSSKI